MPRLVPGEGDLSRARIVLIGEAPGRQEDRMGRPFVGSSGELLIGSYYMRRNGEKGWWEEVGLKRSDFYIDNVYPFRPQSNRIDRIPLDQLEHYAAALRKKLAAEWRHPRLIVPTGNIALRALMRKPLFGRDSPRITDWRGSIMRYQLGDGRTVKMIPTIHPAATFRRPALAKLCLADWYRIAGDLQFPQLRLPKRTHTINPTRAEVRAFEKAINDAYNHAPREAVLSVDIETSPKQKLLICVGFALTPTHSITLKFDRWQRTIARWCAHPIAKLGQNFLYDRYWLTLFGCPVANHKWDTLALHHTLDASLPHDLATLGSLYTRQPFWKRDHKEAEKIIALKTPYNALATYNGIDVTATLEIKERLVEELHNEASR